MHRDMHVGIVRHQGRELVKPSMSCVQWTKLPHRTSPAGLANSRSCSSVSSLGMPPMKTSDPCGGWFAGSLGSVEAADLQPRTTDNVSASLCLAELGQTHAGLVSDHVPVLRCLLLVGRRCLCSRWLIRSCTLTGCRPRGRWHAIWLSLAISGGARGLCSCLRHQLLC